ncbi:hypothetical protein NOF04DRAFT_1176966, partial [Fusarium oxysporum II5]
ALSGIFRHIIIDSKNQVLKGTIIIIDALNKYTHEKRESSSAYHRTLAYADAQVRWIISSRNWVEFEKAFICDSLTSR